MNIQLYAFKLNINKFSSLCNIFSTQWYYLRAKIDNLYDDREGW